MAMPRRAYCGLSDRVTKKPVSLGLVNYHALAIIVSNGKRTMQLSPVLVTALASVIGYDKALRIAHFW